MALGTKKSALLSNYVNLVITIALAIYVIGVSYAIDFHLMRTVQKLSFHRHIMDLIKILQALSIYVYTHPMKSDYEH